MKKRVLCFGDSNTWGAVPEDGSRYPEDVRWTGVLQRELGEGYQVIEEGYNGRTSVFDDPVEGRLSGIQYFGPCCDSQSPIHIDPAYKNHPLFYDMFGEWGTERSQELAQAYEEFAMGAGISFLDGSLYGKASTVDGVHMHPDSHDRLGRAMAAKVRKILE